MDKVRAEGPAVKPPRPSHTPHTPPDRHDEPGLGGGAFEAYLAHSLDERCERTAENYRRRIDRQERTLASIGAEWPDRAKLIREIEDNRRRLATWERYIAELRSLRAEVARLRGEGGGR